MLGVETAQVPNVPRIVRDFACLLMLQSIHSSANYFSDDERSFPWRRELMHLLLLQSQYEVAYFKGSGVEPSTVVIA